MKRTGISLGYVKVAYPLDNIFRRSLKEFQEADAAAVNANQRSEASVRDADLAADAFTSRQRAMEIGVVLLISAGAYLEQTINDYALTFIDGNWYDEHLDNLRAITKWILLPRLCQNKEITEDNPAINAFREFVKARNAIVHHKRRELDERALGAASKTSSEVARFWAACRNAESTVEGLISLLTSPPPSKHSGK